MSSLGASWAGVIFCFEFCYIFSERSDSALQSRNYRLVISPFVIKLRVSHTKSFYQYFVVCLFSQASLVFFIDRKKVGFSLVCSRFERLKLIIDSLVVLFERGNLSVERHICSCDYSYLVFEFLFIYCEVRYFIFEPFLFVLELFDVGFKLF